MRAEKTVLARQSPQIAKLSDVKGSRPAFVTVGRLNDLRRKMSLMGSIGWFDRKQASEHVPEDWEHHR